MSRFSLNASNSRAQPVDVGHLREPHEVRLAGHDHVRVALDRLVREGALRERDRVHHHPVHLLAGFLQLGDEPRPHAGQLLPAEQLVQVGRGAAQFLGREVTVELHDAVLHLAAVDDQDRQHAVARKSHEFDLRERRMGLARDRHDAGEMGEARDRLRGRRHQRLRVASSAGRGGGWNSASSDCVGRLVAQQRIDEVAVALVGRHAARRGVRRGRRSHAPRGPPSRSGWSRPKG